MSLPTPPSVSDPLRILYLCPPDAKKISILEGDSVNISTPYYSATIPVWHDRITLTPNAVQEWETAWRTDEAGEVVRSIGAWVVAIRKPSKKDDLDILRTLLTGLSSIIAHHTSDAVDSYSMSNEPLLLCLGMRESTTPRLEMPDEEWEDFCQESGGWEWIDGEAEGVARNDFGEKVGIARLREALEAHEWENADEGVALSDVLTFEEDEELPQSAAEAVDQDFSMKEPMLARKGNKPKGDSAETAGNVVDDGEDDHVQELESMMLKLQAIKDMGADLPEAERRKFAAKAIRDVMKNM